MRCPVPVAVLLLLAAGCGSSGDGAGEAAPTPTVGPTALAAAAPPGAPGTRRVGCDLDAPSGPVTLLLDLPAGFRDRGACTWRRPLPGQPRSSGQPSAVSVSLVGSDPDRVGATVRELYDDLLPNAVPEGGFDGDDTIEDLVLRRDVAVFGPTRGDIVSWQCYCDGVPVLRRVAQAAGIELSWTAVPELEARTDAELAATLRTAGR